VPNKLTHKLHTSKRLCAPRRWPRTEAETFRSNNY